MKTKLLKNKIIVIAAVFYFGILGNLNAAGTLIMKPENPGPYEDVEITFKTYSFDIDNALLTWYVDNKVILSGKGEKTLKIKTGAIGTTIPLVVNVKNAAGEE